MKTLRQVYIDTLLAQFQANADLTALATVDRSVLRAMGMNDRAVIVPHRGGGQMKEAMTGYTDRWVELLVTIVTRDLEPDRVADEVLEVAHPIVMALTGLNLIDVSQMEESDDPPVFVSQNDTLCLCTSHYVIHYRSMRDDLSR